VIQALTQANAREFLALSGDLVSTDPTVANVMGLVIVSVRHNENDCGRVL